MVVIKSATQQWVAFSFSGCQQDITPGLSYQFPKDTRVNTWALYRFRLIVF